MKILIADDDRVARAVLQEALSDAGHEVVTVADGEAAWRLLQAPDAPKLAVLDWMMPGMDGLEVIRRARAAFQTEPVYTILLTAHEKKDGLVGALEAGANDYLIKPFDPAELRARIQVGERVVRLQTHLAQRLLDLETALESRKRAEEALLAERECLRALMDNLPFAIYFKDRSSRFTRISRELARCFGLTGPEQAIGLTDHDVHGQEHAAEAFEDEQRIIRTGEPIVDKEEKETWPDGRVTWASTTKLPLVHSSGEIVGTFGVSRDITQRRQAEQASRFLAALVESSGDAIIGIDLDGTVVSWNRGAEQLYGYGAEEIIGRSEALLIPADRSVELTQILDAMKQGDRILHFDTERLNKGGSRIDIALTISPIKDQRGNTTGVAVVGHDITARKRAEDELYQSRQKLQLILDSIPQRVFWKDRNLTYLGCSRAFAGDAGLQNAEEIVGKTDFDLSWKATAELYRADDKLVMDQESPKLNVEEPQSRPDGTLVWLRTSKLPLRDRAGNMAGVLGTYEDITERKHAEDAMRRSEEKFRSLVANIPEVVWTLDAQGRLPFITPNVEALSGYAAAEIQAGGVEILFRALHPDDAGMVKAALDALFAKGQTYDLECRVSRKSGEQIWVRHRAVAIYEREGVRYADGLISDITEHKLAEESLRASEERYRMLFERNLAGVFRTTLDGQVLDCNESMAHILGYPSASEVFSLNLKDMYYVRSDRAQFLARLQAERSLTSYELKLRRKDGNPAWLIANVTLVRQDGEDTIEGSLVDITDRKLAEQALAEEANLAALRAEVGAALIRCGTLREGLQESVEALVRRTGVAFARIWILNHAAAELELEASAGMYTHIDGAHRRLPVDSTYKIGRIAQRRTPHLSNDVQSDPEVSDHEWAKREALVSFAGHPLIVENRVVGVIAAFGRQPLAEATLLAFASVTDQIAQFVQAKRSEEALQRSEERARLLFATIPHAAYVFDLETLDFLEVNDVAVERYGYARDEFLRMKITAIRPADQVEPLKEYVRKIQGSSDLAGQWKHLAKDGRIIDVEINYHVLNYDGRRAALTIAQDVTERRKLELDLRHSQKLEAVGGLASGIAHEINTPIQFVGDNLRFLQDGFASLSGLLPKFEELREAAKSGNVEPTLLDGLSQAVEEADLDYLNEEIPKALSQSLDGVSRVATIVQAMKDFAHPEQNQKAAADLNKALSSTLVVARNEIKYVADVTTDFGELPSVECHLGDLNQVFLNLVINAAHAIGDCVTSTGKRGTIGVRTRRDGDRVEIAISDTGSGIPEAIRAKIFEPFFTTKAVGRGTGQGLAISRSIVVEKHGGTLTFDTELGRGTTFLIGLPVVSPVKHQV